MKATWLLPVVLVLAGCTDAGTDVGEDDVVVDSALPQLQGWLFDPAVRPLAGATVTVLETGEMRTSDADGRYEFATGLPTGTPVVLVAKADGFTPASKRTTLAPEQHLRLNFTLEPEPVLQPYSQVVTYTGFIHCQTAAETEDARHELDCSGGQEDKDTWQFPVASDLAGTVLEVFWEPQQAGAAFMRARMETTGFGDQNTLLDEKEGESPLRLTLGQAQAQKYYQEGGMVRVTIEPSANLEEQEMGAGVAAAVQQSFEIFATNFYVTPAPATYSIADT